MIVVHHLNESRSQRILWLLEELRAPYEIAFYQRDTRTNLAPTALREIHPLGKSPVITEGDRVIAESGAIIDYIIRRHGDGRLQPDPATEPYDDYVHWLHYAEGSATLPLLMKSLTVRVGKVLAPLGRQADGEVDLHLQFINESLSGRDYLLGGELTGADVQMSFVGELAGAVIDRSTYPNLDAWCRRLQARPAYQAALARGRPPGPHDDRSG
jgi:glutathione S-transferase